MTRFQVGQKVRATIDAQGMQQGVEYEVVSISVEHYAFGSFFEYELGREGSVTLFVRNAHLLCEEA